MKKKSFLLGLILLSIGMTFTACNTNNSNNETKPKEQEVIKEGKHIYLAAPLFSQADRDYNVKITSVLSPLLTATTTLITITSY